MERISKPTTAELLRIVARIMPTAGDIVIAEKAF